MNPNFKSDIKEMSLTAMKKEWTAIGREINSVSFEVSRTQPIIDLRDAARNAESAYKKALRAAKKEATEELQTRRAEISARYGEVKEKRKAPPPPLHIKTLLALCNRGVNFGPKAQKTVWVSPTGRFFIVTTPGSSQWSGRGASSYYPSSHVLMDCSTWDGNEKVRRDGPTLWSDVAVKGTEVEGRLLKVDRESMQAIALKKEKEEPEVSESGWWHAMNKAKQDRVGGAALEHPVHTTVTLSPKEG